MRYSFTDQLQLASWQKSWCRNIAKHALMHATSWGLLILRVFFLRGQMRQMRCPCTLWKRKMCLWWRLLWGWNTRRMFPCWRCVAANTIRRNDLLCKKWNNQPGQDRCFLFLCLFGFRANDLLAISPSFFPRSVSDTLPVIQQLYCSVLQTIDKVGQLLSLKWCIVYLAI